VYQGSLNFIIYFYFPILKELIYVSYCFISINSGLLVVVFMTKEYYINKIHNRNCYILKESRFA